LSVNYLTKIHSSDRERGRDRGVIEAKLGKILLTNRVLAWEKKTVLDWI